MAKKKLMTTSQMASRVKAEKAAWMVSVLVLTATVSPRNAHALRGNGLRTSPTAVLRKMAVRFQACGKASRPQHE